MKKILISLVSEQTIPNVLFIKELIQTNVYIDEYLFLSTDKMDKNNTTQNIIKSCNISDGKWRKILIPEANIKEIICILKKENFPKYNEYLLNISGGTKIMALGAYDFFTKNFENIKVCYLPIGENKISMIYPENKECYIEYRLNIKEYLLSYGLIASINEVADSFAIEPKEFLPVYRNNRELINTLIKIQNINKLKNKFKKKSVNLIDILTEDFKEENKLDIDNEKLFCFLEKDCGLDPKNIKHNEIKYITGGWFEQYVYDAIKKSINLDNNSIAVNVSLEKGKVRNEFDVMFTLNNNLHIIECKTGLSGKEGNLVNDTLYKQQALRRNFGLTVKLFLFTLDKINKESDIDRAKLFNITIVDSEYFENEEKLTNKLKEIFKV